MSLYLSGILLDDGAQAGGTVAIDGEGFREYPVGSAEFAELFRSLESAGFPGRLPSVEGKNDTSDSWAAVLLYVSLDGAAQTLSLSLLSSGFEGTDAPALHRFFEVLLSVAGVRDNSIHLDLVGP
jgi:hypothetical protein